MSDALIQQSIARLVPIGSRVLDLGCGDGALLALLQNERGCSGYGVELADGNLRACVERGVNAIQLNLDEGLTMFSDNSFDVVLQIDTLQHLRNAEVMLRETARVGPISELARMQTLPNSRARMPCVYWIPLACRTARRSASCPICAPARPFSSLTAAVRRAKGLPSREP